MSKELACGTHRLLISVILTGLLAAYPLDSEPLGRRLYYHFYANNHFDASREPFIIKDLPFQLTDEDYGDIMQMVDENGRVRSASATTALSADHVATDYGHRFQNRLSWWWVPDWIRGGTVNGTVAYSSLVAQDNPEGAAAMLRVRDRVLRRMRQHQVLNHEIYGVTDGSPWAAFSVTSKPNEGGKFRWHYDAESADEYRALFVATGGDDCGEPAVHWRDREGVAHDLEVKSGHGYMIRGSQTFHAVYGGGCSNGSTPAIRHMVGFQLSRVPNRSPMPLCSLMLAYSAHVNWAWAKTAMVTIRTGPLLWSGSSAFLCTLVLVVAARLFSADLYDVSLLSWLIPAGRVPLISDQPRATAGYYPDDDKVSAEHQACWNRMLDIGIGTGSALAANSAAIVANRINVVGIDYDAAYIKKAEAVIREAGLEHRARVHCCSIFEERLASRLLAENENRFDTAYFSGSFTLLPDPAKALQICRELVKPNGYIYITQTFQTTYSPVMEFMKPLLKYATTIDFGALTYEEELNKLLRGATGLEVIRNDVIDSVHAGGGSARMVILRVVSTPS